MSVEKKTSQKQNEPIVEEKEGSKVECRYPSGHIETFYQCPMCKSNNKRSFFSTATDLKTHVQRLHGGYPDYMRLEVEQPHKLP